jgi:tetratricopeptide (TPR) repeat protein
MLTSPMCTHYVLGEAGIGKSRLVRHLLQDQREDVVTVFLEADTILRKSMNSLPRFLRAVFEISQIDLDALDGGTAMDRLIEWLEEREVEAELIEELRRTSSGLLALLGQVAADSLYAQLDPQARFELTASAVRALVGAISEVYPLLVVLDNAHALDEDTRNIFSRVVSTSPGNHFGMIFVGRGAAEASPFGIEEHVDMDQMTVLRGLTAQEVREIAGNVIQGPVEQSLVDFIIRRVGTNPLYVTELARYLVQHRLLTRGESGYQVSTESVSLPTEINALLVARVDALPVTLKEAAQAAAILGAEFEPIVLEKLVNAAEEFEATLDQGVSAGLWQKTDDGKYRFQQDLVRQAMEEMQLTATLKRLHARAATLLRQLRPDDPSLYADLAYHYIRADMPDEARSALRRAADYALENFKNEKALEFLRSYQDYASDIDERIAAYRDMASIYELTGRWQDALDTLTYGVGLSVITNNLGARARLLSNLGEVYRKQSENATAIRILEQARRLAQHEQDFSTYAEALIYLGRSHRARGDFGAALAHFDQALQTSTEHDDLKLEGLALYYQGVVYRDQNRFNEADRNFRRAYALFEQIRDDRLSTYPLYDLGVVRLYQGQIAEAKNYFQRVLDVYQRIGYESGASAATLNLGVLRDRRGDFKGAIRRYQEAREIAERINEHMAIGYTLFSIGATYYKMGDNRKSLAYLRDAFAILKRLGAKGYYGFVLSYLVSLFARTGNADRAVHTAYQHTQVTSQIGTDPENGRALLGLAVVLQKQPELSHESQQMLKRIAHYYKLHRIDPDSFFRKAIEISEPPAYVDTLIPAHFRYAEYLREQGDEATFRRHLKTAFELAVDAHWDRFVRTTRDNHGELLQELGVNTDVETEDFDLGTEAGTGARVAAAGPSG